MPTAAVAAAPIADSARRESILAQLVGDQQCQAHVHARGILAGTGAEAGAADGAEGGAATGDAPEEAEEDAPPAAAATQGRRQGRRRRQSAKARVARTDAD